MGLTKQALQHWFKTQRTLYGKLSTGGVSGEGEKHRLECQEWIPKKLHSMGSHITRQNKPRHPASIKLTLVQKKASAMITRHEFLSMSASDEEGDVGGPPANTIDAPPADTIHGPPPPKKTWKQTADDELKKVQSQQQATQDKLAEMIKRADAADCTRRTWSTWMTT